jgi:hypothetical protein
MSARVLGVVLVVVACVAGLILSLIKRDQPRPDRSQPVDRPQSRSEVRSIFAAMPAEDQLYRLLDAVSPNLFSTLCILIAGCLQLAGGDGLYWLAAAVLLALGGGVVNAWLFLTR